MGDREGEDGLSGLIWGRSYTPGYTTGRIA